MSNPSPRKRGRPISPPTWGRLVFSKFALLALEDDDLLLAKRVRRISAALSAGARGIDPFSDEILQESEAFLERDREYRHEKPELSIGKSGINPTENPPIIRPLDVHYPSITVSGNDSDPKSDPDLGLGNAKGKGDPLLEVFDLARRSYPGSRRGLSVEWVNFKSKHPDYREIVSLLLPAIEKEKAHKALLKAAHAFCPEWKNFQTWLNQSCWTQEFPEVTQNGRGHDGNFGKSGKNSREYPEHLAL